MKKILLTLAALALLLAPVESNAAPTPQGDTLTQVEHATPIALAKTGCPCGKACKDCKGCKGCPHCKGAKGCKSCPHNKDGKGCKNCPHKAKCPHRGKAGCGCR